MDKLLTILMPVFIVVIIIINAIAKMKEVEKTQRAKQGGEWKELGGAGEVRKFLQQAATGAARTPETRPGGETPRRAATGRPGGEGFLPKATGPVAGTFAAPGIEPSARRKAKHVRQAPPPPARPAPTGVRRLLVDRPRVGPSGASAPGSASGANEAAKAAAPDRKRHEAGSQRARVAEDAAMEAGDVRRGRATTRVPELGRSRLRDAIVMAEVLGTPVAFRAPKA